MAIVNTENELMDKIVTLCKRRGFVFQSSEIYGGFNGFWDYALRITIPRSTAKKSPMPSMKSMMPEIIF